MFEYTHGNLVRQQKGLEVLRLLLEEEFSHLKERRPDQVTVTEFSIHELMRQLAVERLELKDVLGGQRLKDMLPMLLDEQQDVINTLLHRIDELEQDCARRASMNAELALALNDQSQALLDHIHGQLQPKKTNTYGKMGTYAQARPEAAFIRGRF